MARIDLRNISIELPVYNINGRSFKKHFLRLATGGQVSKDASQHIIVRSLNDVTLTINHGDRIGLIGHNGAGKSTFLRLLAKIYEPSQGEIKIDGQVFPMLDLMQGIETEFTGYENIMIRGTILGIPKEQIKKQIENIATLSGLGDYLSMPVRTYSHGMMVRLAFAISTSIMPDILLIDEIFNAVDASFLEKVKTKMASLLDQSNIVVMATHTDELIREFCNKALLLEGGSIKYYGSVDKALEYYHQSA